MIQHLNHHRIELRFARKILHEKGAISRGHQNWIDFKSRRTGQGHKQQIDFIGKGISPGQYVLGVFIFFQIFLLSFLLRLFTFVANGADLLRPRVDFAQLRLVRITRGNQPCRLPLDTLGLSQKGLVLLRSAPPQSRPEALRPIESNAIVKIDPQLQTVFRRGILFFLVCRNVFHIQLNTAVGHRSWRYVLRQAHAMLLHLRSFYRVQSKVCVAHK